MLDSLLTKAGNVVNRPSRIMLIADAILSKVAPQSTASAWACGCINCEELRMVYVGGMGCPGQPWCMECKPSGYPCAPC